MELSTSVDIFFLKYVQSQPVTLQTDILMDVRAILTDDKSMKGLGEKCTLSVLHLIVQRYNTMLKVNVLEKFNL